MTRRRPSRRLIAITATCLAIIGALLFAVVSPETTLGYGLFRCVYASPVSKPLLFERYSSILWAHEGGYIPEHTDRFLCSRLEADSPEGEVDAIANFYALQASGREGRIILSLSDNAKQKVIGSIMRNLDTFDLELIERPLLLVEELRRGEEIWKGSFSPVNSAESGNWAVWWKKRGVKTLKGAYRKWWQSPDSWAVKKTKNPLAGTGIETSGP